jgi:hypothetical protein
MDRLWKKLGIRDKFAWLNSLGTVPSAWCTGKVWWLFQGIWSNWMNGCVGWNQSAADLDTKNRRCKVVANAPELMNFWAMKAAAF